jgi:Cullin, a subunit of E3 ubiquitin ligase
MLNDVSLSKDYQKKFSEKKPNNPINVLILTSGNWPALGENDTCKMPKLMESYAKEFEAFYKGLDAAFSSRILKWVLAEGKVEMVVNIQGQRTLLDVKTHQACILLLFEKENDLSYAKIQEFTGLKDNLLNEYLRFMCGHAPVSLFKRQKKDVKLFMKYF